MAKRKAPPEPIPREPVETRWRGETIYRCPFCARDSDRAGVIAEHIDRDHPVTEVSHGATDADENDSAGTEPDRGRGGDDDRGQHDG